MAKKKYPGALSDQRIEELKKSGFSVSYMYDGDPPLYAWFAKYGSQADWKDRQPLRATPEQAWADCDAYYRGQMPLQPDQDWTIQYP